METHETSYGPRVRRHAPQQPVVHIKVAGHPGTCAFEQLLDRDVRPAADDLGDVLLIDLFLDELGGALLVGNTGDGHINGYNLENGAFLGALANENGTPLTLPTLWSLAFGNGHEGGASDTLFFTAGVDYEQHGLFGAIQAPERRGADTAGSGSFDPTAPGEPGDYPLPPSSGPAFRASSAERPTLISDLLPLRESSLALVPTLSTVSQTGMGIGTHVPNASIVAISFSRSLLIAAPSSNTIILFSGGHTYGTIAAARYFCGNMHGQLRHLLKGRHQNFVVLVSAHIIDGYPTKIKMERAYA